MKPTRNILKSSESLQRNLDRMHYAPSDDIFNKLAEEQDIDPENILKKKFIIKPRNNKWNEKDFIEDVSGSDLDIPGSELDDAMEQIGSEDEENNGYSLGGDGHNDLDEDQVNQQRLVFKDKENLTFMVLIKYNSLSSLGSTPYRKYTNVSFSFQIYQTRIKAANKMKYDM